MSIGSRSSTEKQQALQADCLAACLGINFWLTAKHKPVTAQHS